MENDPLEINKLPDVIKDAQNEISTLDVLVCGKCHETFHYVEQFQEHQGSDSNCKGISQLKDIKKCESKPQTWGFLLWKHMHIKKTESDASLSPWLLYQKWCKISEEHRDSWIAAGQNLMFVNKITTGKVQEVKATVKNKLAKVNALDNSHKSNDSLEEGEIRPSRFIEKPKKVIDKRPVLKSTQPTANSISAIKNGSPKKALRTCKNDIIVMGTIDKILNRRYNAKTKANEYLIKWADSEDTANTWEPRKNVEMCKTLVEEYDQSFDKVKTIKSNDNLASSTPMDVDETPTSGRPQRTSKKKALNQVKAWCGDITEENEESEKRKFLSDDEDSTDSFEKKFKMEEDTESSDEEKPPITIRKVGRPPSNSFNGLAKKTNEISNLVPTQRVVRVSQKQMPNLATGVYLMSKTDGIVKLDSNAPSGSPLLKVGQKIGQTQIKMVQKKEIPTKTPIKATTKYVQKADGKVLASTPKVGSTSNVMRKTMSQVSVKSARIIENEKHDVFGAKIVDDEDSDGLEELAFPADLPLPVPDSPPREFTLCPLTGKVLGQMDEPEETLPENASLDTLVQLAVMDSPPELDDLKEGKVLTKNEVPATISTIPITPKIEESKIHTITDIEMDIHHSEISKNSQAKLIMPTPASIVTTPKAPLLNKVLSTPKPLQTLAPKLDYPKKLLSTPTQIRPKVTNPVVTTTKPLINRPVPSTTIIHKVASSRHKTVLPKPSVHDPVLKRTTNVTTYKPANRRIPNTIPPPKPVIKPTITKVVAPAPPPQPVVQPPTTIMSMPILTADEEQPTTSNIVTPLPEIEQPLNEPENDDLGELSTYNMLESETPILITGEDGTIYQVAGQNEDGQTILISEDADGHQQCVIVASDNLIMDTGSNVNEEGEAVEPTFVEESESEGGDGENDNEPSQVVAQIVNADPPSPGGTRKVVLLLPDGNLVKTEVSAEQYASI